MAIDIITTADLKAFKKELLSDIENLTIDYNRISIDKWIRSKEAMAKLQISYGTLQSLRNNGSLPYSKIGGIILYNQEELNRLLERNKLSRFLKS